MNKWNINSEEHLEEVNPDAFLMLRDCGLETVKFIGYAEFLIVSLIRLGVGLTPLEIVCINRSAFCVLSPYASSEAA